MYQSKIYIIITYIITFGSKYLHICHNIIFAILCYNKPCSCCHDCLESTHTSVK